MQQNGRNLKKKSLDDWGESHLIEGCWGRPANEAEQKV